VTALPQPPGRLLTVADYAKFGEDDTFRWELQEGNLVMSPSPTPRHMIASGRLFIQLHSQLPPNLCPVQDVDVDLRLVPVDQPGSSRRPDLVVVDQAAVARVDREGGLLRADEVVLVVEIVSPGSRRTDHVIKRAEYADAGIPTYWIVDLDSPASLTACHLTAGFGYQDGGAVADLFIASEPYPVRIELNALV
jgi:Uma2 family endonuclease